jgi:hypothetical protein
MNANERLDLLHTLCDLLPEPEASMVRSMSPEDPITYVEAYTACTRAGVNLDRALRRRILVALDAQIGEGDGRVIDPVT